MEKTESIKNLAIALIAAQKEIGVVLKNAENPYFKSSYADLKAVIDCVKEPLNKHGICFLQPVNMDSEGKPYIETIIIHESGESITSKTPVYCDKPNNPQALGSGVSYAKRYALQAMLGLPTADDDGQAAKAKAKPEIPAPTEAEMKTIDELCKKLQEKTDPAHFVVDGKKVANAIYATKKSYAINDMDAAVANFTKNLVKFCVKFAEPEQDSDLDAAIEETKKQTAENQAKLENPKTSPFTKEGDKANAIVTKAFEQFRQKHQEFLANQDGMADFVMAKFIAEIKILPESKGKLPTNEASIPKILNAIKPERVLAKI